MQLIRNNHGIALVTSLMLTLISLVIVMSLLYVVTRGLTASGQHKKYHTALDASYGGSEIMIKDVLPVIMQNYSAANMASTVQTSFAAVSLQFLADQNCFQKKITTATANWPSSCNNSPDPKKAPDISVTLQSASGNPFIVYSKIVDTIPGNTDTSGLQLEGKGVAEASSVLTPQSFPYVYRMEIQGERSANATTQANIEVLYAY